MGAPTMRQARPITPKTSEMGGAPHDGRSSLSCATWTVRCATWTVRGVMEPRAGVWAGVAGDGVGWGVGGTRRAAAPRHLHGVRAVQQRREQRYRRRLHALPRGRVDPRRHSVAGLMRGAAMRGEQTARVLRVRGVGIGVAAGLRRACACPDNQRDAAERERDGDRVCE